MYLVSSDGINPSNDLHQGADEHLPREKGLRDQAQDDVPTLAVEIVSPLALGLVLLPLHNGETVEEDEE